MGEQRLQKVMARAGVASRRHSEELITAGRVTVNGEVVGSLGTKVDPERDRVAVDGRELDLGVTHAYLALNKPRGYVTTMSDPQGRPTVAEFLPPEPPGLFAVGRLDMDTDGLLLITNDGELADRLMHPRHHVSKTYRAVIAGQPTEYEIQHLREGVQLDDGVTAPAEVEYLGSGGKTSLVRMTIREGRKRQVRRMFSALGHPVVELRRVRFGPVELGGQAPGTLRALTAEEVSALKDAGGR
ncbi:MAG TPA: pseudouridine synthase [Coriobacteriia bacterium]